MTDKQIIKEFEKEFALKSKDGKRLPTSFDPNAELKERFVVFLLKALSQQKEQIEKQCEERVSKLEQVRCEEMLDHQKEQVKKIIDLHLAYCRKHNGLPYCKNCGLSPDDLKLLD